VIQELLQTYSITNPEKILPPASAAYLRRWRFRSLLHPWILVGQGSAPRSLATSRLTPEFAILPVSFRPSKVFHTPWKPVVLLLAAALKWRVLLLANRVKKCVLLLANLRAFTRTDRRIFAQLNHFRRGKALLKTNALKIKCIKGVRMHFSISL
jgi:hypothetical protein